MLFVLLLVVVLLLVFGIGGGYYGSQNNWWQGDPAAQNPPVPPQQYVPGVPAQPPMIVATQYLPVPSNPLFVILAILIVLILVCSLFGYGYYHLGYFGYQHPLVR